jgi:hypothetical protein
MALHPTRLIFTVVTAMRTSNLICNGEYSKSCDTCHWKIQKTKPYRLIMNTMIRTVKYYCVISPADHVMEVVMKMELVVLGKHYRISSDK